MNIDYLADFLRKKMREENLSTYEIARRSGGIMNANTITRILNGNNKQVTLATIEAIARGLQMQPEDLVRIIRGVPAGPSRFAIYADTFDARELSESEWQYLETFFKDQVDKWKQFQIQRNKSLNKIEKESVKFKENKEKNRRQK